MIWTNVIKPLFRSFKRCNWHNNDYKSKKVLQSSIFGNTGDTLGKNNKQYNFIHGVIKYKILVPGMHLMNWLLRGYSTKIDDFFFRNLRVYEKSWDEATEIMSRKYNKCFETHASYKLVKKLLILICKWDTATLEFMNCLMHSITKNMQKEYKGHKRVYHVVYSASFIHDPVYFNMGQYILGKENLHPDDAKMKWMQNKRNKAIRAEIKKMLILCKDYESLKKALKKHKKQIVDL